MDNMQQLAELLAQHDLPAFKEDSTPDLMLDHMGVHMHKALWPLGVSMINTNSVSADEAYEFIRRAVHVVDASDIAVFLIEISDCVHYDFMTPSMIHYIAPFICAYFSTFPTDPSALHGLLRMHVIRRSPIIIEEVCHVCASSHIEPLTWKNTRCCCASDGHSGICLENRSCMQHTSFTLWISSISPGCLHRSVFLPGSFPSCALRGRGCSVEMMRSLRWPCNVTMSTCCPRRS